MLDFLTISAFALDANIQLRSASFIVMNGKAAAYERLLMPGQAWFDACVEPLNPDKIEEAALLLTNDVGAALRLFIRKAN